MTARRVNLETVAIIALIALALAWRFWAHVQPPANVNLF